MRVRRWAGLVLALCACLSVVAVRAPWTQTTSISAPLTAAKVGSSMTLTGAGTLTGNSYALGGLLFQQYGYLDVVNSSTIPAELTMTVNVAALVAGTTVIACTVPWNTVANTCAGIQTTIADAALLALPVVNYTAVGMSPPGGHYYLQCRVAGVIAGITLVLSAPVTRAAGDRT